jgi:hypothetical protein
MRQGMSGLILRLLAGNAPSPTRKAQNSQFLWKGSENNHGQPYLKRTQFIHQLSAGFLLPGKLVSMPGRLRRSLIVIGNF